MISIMVFAVIVAVPSELWIIRKSIQHEESPSVEF